MSSFGVYECEAKRLKREGCDRFTLLTLDKNTGEADQVSARPGRINTYMEGHHRCIAPRLALLLESWYGKDGDTKRWLHL